MQSKAINYKWSGIPKENETSIASRCRMANIVESHATPFIVHIQWVLTMNASFRIYFVFHERARAVRTRKFSSWNTWVNVWTEIVEKLLKFGNCSRFFLIRHFPLFFTSSHTYTRLSPPSSFSLSLPMASTLNSQIISRFVLVLSS